jgi:hypothetical protein
MSNNESHKNDCCPQFDPTGWDDKIFDWDNKKFIKDKVCTFFYMPCNFGSVMKRLTKTLNSAGVELGECICLSDHTSKWNMDIYLSVDKEIPGCENTTISGKIISKVYEGPFRDTGKWCKNFDEYVKGKNIKYSKMYMWYTTCPKCAKKYGKNYVVILGKVE